MHAPYQNCIVDWMGSLLFGGHNPKKMLFYENKFLCRCLQETRSHWEEEEVCASWRMVQISEQPSLLVCGKQFRCGESGGGEVVIRLKPHCRHT